MTAPDSLTTADGCRLHLRHWHAPGPGPAHGTVQIVHGLGEHIGRYAAVARSLNAAGWHVAGHDQRGHGRSEGPRGTVPPGPGLLADLSVVIDLVRAERGPGHHVLLGHSMGGLVAARFVAEGARETPAAWARTVDGLVLSSPAFDIGMNPLQRALLTVLGPLVPDLRLGNGLKPAWISRDPAIVKAYRADPLVHDRVTPRLVRFMLDSGACAQARAPHWRVPTLLMWAGVDRCVAPRGSVRFAEAAPESVLTARVFDALAHEIFNEPEREQVLQHLTCWLTHLAHTAHLAPQPHPQET